MFTAILLATLLAAYLFVTAFGSFHIGDPPSPNAAWYAPTNIPYFAVRAALLSLWSTAIALAFSNYRSERHNQIVNEHRAHALLTMDELKSPEGKVYPEAIAKATEAIFTPEPTGFSNKDATQPTLSATDLAKLLGKN